MDDVRTEGGGYVDDGVDINKGDFVGGSKYDHSAKTNRNEGAVNININTDPAPKPTSSSSRGRLMPEVEQELRRYILDLTKAVSRLEVTVDKNNDFTKEQVDAVRDQVKAIREQSEMFSRQLTGLAGLGIVTPAKPLPTWTPIASVIFLGICALCLLFLVLYFTTGGA